jgi:hypothetical protein
MPEHRIYPLDKADRIVAASTVIVCDADEQAVAEATALGLHPKVEVWQGSRVVAVLTTASAASQPVPPRRKRLGSTRSRQPAGQR